MRDNQTIINQACAFLAADPRILLAVLHGSRAKGTARPDSDLDLGIAGEAPFTSDQLAEISSSLEAHLDIPIDLVDLNRAQGIILSKAITGLPLKDHVPLRTRLALQAMDFYENLLPAINTARKAKAREFTRGN
mgnify:CR=1 FL=1